MFPVDKCKRNGKVFNVQEYNEKRNVPYGTPEWTWRSHYLSRQNVKFCRPANKLWNNPQTFGLTLIYEIILGCTGRCRIAKV